ncbi:MAG: hypothetical protein HY852_02680 [Bradyrhizobium sp.]|uniref:hypothetical protein n=1 Tax=Bradyrhizobium sp. TaxID=376 RepID=UPI0025BB9FD0|nr:hypothetical protein [Bradyrhizobium sp.]MBI5260708.1 hypothetical protein [Bradyrhizobium sp.]
MLANIVFRCPNTGINVQHPVEHQEDGSSDSFAPVQCPACVRLHFVNRKTMKPSGRNDS